MQRVSQILLIVSFVAFCWLGMQVVHESGHVIGAWVTGGSVEKVVLKPLVFSHTDLSRNPHPLCVVWAGPLLGCLLPLAALVLAKVVNSPGIYLFRFFAGFCLVANGVYIAAGSFLGGADPGDMMRSGSPQWLLILFGLITVPAGLFLWHRQGVHFGLGRENGKVHPLATVTSLMLLVLLIAAELICSH